MTITYVLVQMVEMSAEMSDIARIVAKARVFQLLTNSSGDGAKESPALSRANVGTSVYGA